MMTQFPTLERLRPLLRVEVAVLVALLLVAVAWFNLSSMIEDAREAEKAVEQRLMAARGALDLSAGNDEKAELEEQLQALQLDQKTLMLASMADALRVRDDILTYVEERKLATKLLQQADECREGEGDEDECHDNGHYQANDRVNQGGLDLVLHHLVLRKIVGQLLQRPGHLSGSLTKPQNADVEPGED